MKKQENDLRTSTVDGAAACERKRMEQEWKDEEWQENQDLLEEEAEYEECGCSDRGCPCGGNKKGWL